MKNILLTAIGSHSTEAICNSLRKLDCNIIGTDIYPIELVGSAPLVDFFYCVPLSTNEKFIDSILKIVHEKNIDTIIPLIDPEVDIFSKNKEMFEKIGVKITVPDEKCVQICRNKDKFYDYFINSSEINLIPTYSWDSVASKPIFPMIAKIKNGRSSQDLFLINDIDTFNNFKEKKNYIFQPYLVGNVYCTDYVRDNFSNDVSISRVELLRESRGWGLGSYGVSIKVEKCEELEKIASFIGAKLNIKGCVNFEFIFNNGKYYLLDINPRFSAGVGFSNLSGYNFVENHLRCFENKKIDKIAPYEPYYATKRYEVRKCKYEK